VAGATSDRAGEVGDSGVATGRGVAVGAPILQTLSALMQLLPQGMPFLQFFWAASGATRTTLSRQRILTPRRSTIASAASGGLAGEIGVYAGVAAGFPLRAHLAAAAGAIAAARGCGYCSRRQEREQANEPDQAGHGPSGGKTALWMMSGGTHDEARARSALGLVCDMEGPFCDRPVIPDGTRAQMSQISNYWRNLCSGWRRGSESTDGRHHVAHRWT
jgi:hypothetical protein